MKSKLIAVCALLLLVPGWAFAQATQTDSEPGITAGGYRIQQAIEVGGRFGVDPSGNSDVYNTFVNLHNGPRLLEQTLSMRSLNHTGTMFDTLYLSSFGYGGDPNNATRMRMDKDHIYKFTGTFRRDINFFDYNLLANPWNTLANPTLPTGTTITPANGLLVVTDSPHRMDTSRKFGDFNLTLLPDSKLSFRLGYGRTVNEGPSYTTYHEGTDINLFQDYRMRSDRYQIGIDVKLLPKTVLSYDQYYEHNKVDTSWVDNNLILNVLRPGAGTPSSLATDPGLIYNVFAGQPCQAAFGGFVGTATTPTQPATTNGVVNINPGCNQYLAYSRFGPTRTSIPTEQLSLVSHAFQNIDIFGTFSYSRAVNDMADFNEFANTLVTRTNERLFQFTGPAKAKTTSVNADLGVTIHFTKNFRVSDTFSFTNWRTPGTWNSSETACFANVASGATIFTPPGSPGGASTCLGVPTVGLPGGTGPDLVTENWIRFLGDRSYYNTAVFEWDFSKFAGVHLGYRYADRTIADKDFSFIASQTTFPGVSATRCPVADQNGQGRCDITEELGDDAESQNFQQHTLLAGIFANPVNGWRLNADLELMGGNGAVTRISPRHSTYVKLRSTYRARQWVTVGGSLNVREGANKNDLAGFASGVFDPGHLDHTRVYGLNVDLHPKDRFGFEFGYTYYDVFSRTSVCAPMGTAVPASVNTVAFRCTNPSPAGPSTAMTMKYKTDTNSGYANLVIRPVKRVTAAVGYDITSVGGATEWRFAPNGNLVQVFAGTFNPATGRGAVNAGPLVNGPNPFVPLGSLSYNWHKPTASLAFEVAKGWTAKGQWNYYDYNEKGAQGIAPAVTPRDFHANAGTLSLRYEF